MSKIVFLLLATLFIIGDLASAQAIFPDQENVISQEEQSLIDGDKALAELELISETQLELLDFDPQTSLQDEIFNEESPIFREIEIQGGQFQNLDEGNQFEQGDYDYLQDYNDDQSDGNFDDQDVFIAVLEDLNNEESGNYQDSNQLSTVLESISQQLGGTVDIAQNQNPNDTAVQTAQQNQNSFELVQNLISGLDNDITKDLSIEPVKQVVEEQKVLDSSAASAEQISNVQQIVPVNAVVEEAKVFDLTGRQINKGEEFVNEDPTIQDVEIFISQDQNEVQGQQDDQNIIEEEVTEFDLTEGENQQAEEFVEEQPVDQEVDEQPVDQEVEEVQVQDFTDLAGGISDEIVKKLMGPQNELKGSEEKTADILIKPGNLVEEIKQIEEIEVEQITENPTIENVEVLKEVIKEEEDLEEKVIASILEDPKIKKRKSSKKKESSETESLSGMSRTFIKEIGFSIIVILAFLFLIFGSRFDMFSFFRPKQKPKSFLIQDDEAQKKLLP